MKLEGLAHQVSFALTTGYALMGINFLIQLGLIPLYIQHLGKVQFGMLMIIFSFINFAALGVGWVSGGLARILGEQAAQQDYESFARIYSTGKMIYLAYALVVILASTMCFLFASSMLSLGEADRPQLEAIKASLGLAALYFLAQYDLAVERLVLVAMKKQSAADVAQAIGLCITGAFIVVWLLNGGGIVGVFLGYLIGTLAARVVSWRCRTGLGLPETAARSWSWRNLESVRKLLGPLGIGYFVYGALLLTLQADMLVVGWLGGPEVAADFAVVWKIPEVILQAIWRIPAALEPHLIYFDVLGQVDRINQLYREGLWWMLGGTGLVACLYSIVGRVVVQWWVGTDLVPSTSLPYVLAGGALFFVGSVRWPAGFAHALAKLPALNRIAGLEVVAKLALTVGLFSHFGYQAPMLAIILVYGCGVFWLYLRLVRSR